MLPKQLLFLTDEHLCAYQWRGGRLSEPEYFHADRPSMDLFMDYLRQHPDRPAYLIADMVEEDFQRQLLPHVGGRARRGLVARRMAMLYRDTPFRHAFVQGREAHGRRDDQVLFAAVTNPGAVQPWLNVIAHAGVPLAAVYSAPFLAVHLVRKLALAQEHLLLITQDSGGLRQTYFQGRHLKFSRLTTMGYGERLADVVAEETDRMQQFLTSTRLTGRGERLHTVVLAPRVHMAALEAACEDGPEVSFEFMDLEVAAQRLRLREPMQVADRLLLTLVGRQAPPSHYPTGAPGRLFRLWQARAGLYAGAATVLAVVLAWSLFNVWCMVSASGTTARLAAEVPQLNARYRALMANLPPAATRTANMRAAVTLAEAISRQGPEPGHLMALLSAALDRAPAVRLTSLDWDIATPTAPPPDALATGQATDAPAPLWSAELGLPAPPVQTLRVEGEIDVGSNDARAVLEAMRAFAQELARNRRLAVEVLTPPVDVRSNVRLAGKAGISTDEGHPAFALRLAWRP